nr:hypothetical protein [Tanacetum cinerariifolium]
MKVEESLKVTFDESPPPTKLSPLVDDDVGEEEEAIRKNTKIVNTNNKEDELIEVDKIVNIKESKNHPLDQVIGNLNQRTLRLKDSKPTKTPMSTEIKLTKDDEVDSVDSSKYRGYELFFKENFFCSIDKRNMVKACTTYMLYYLTIGRKFNFTSMIIYRMEEVINKRKGPMPFSMLLTRLYNHILAINPQSIVPIARAYGGEKEDTPFCDVLGFEKSKMKLIRHVSFVDCPGHDISMATMLTIAAIMDGVLILISLRVQKVLDNKLEDGEWMWNSIQNGPYQRPMIPNPDKTHQQILKPLSKMTEGNKKQYIADVRVMNYLLQAIPKDVYNSVDASKEGESLESVYERLTTLVNIMDRNNVRPISVSINTKFLNCLQPEWSKYVTMVRHNQMEMQCHMMCSDGNAETVPSYDAKAVSEAIAAQPKMYNGDMLHSVNLKIDSPDSEETLEDAEESRLKMRNKMVQINYGKINALYETFVPQQELFVEQTYFSIPSTFNNGSESKDVTSDLPIPKMPKKEELLQFKIQNVWILVDCPKGVRPIGTKWVIKNKKDEREIVIRNKARLVAQGHTQEEGIDYEEVFALVARIEAIRLFLAYASFMRFTVYQMDVKSAFLCDTIHEEAPRAWYGTLSKYLLANGFQRGTIDQTLFIRKHIGDFLLVQVYVDDIIFGSSNPQLCREFEALMHDKFQMSAMGDLNFFLGMQVLQKKDDIFLSQDKYVGDILKKFRYSDVRSANTPMDKKNPWEKDGPGKDVELHLYRSMIGSLMYLTASM